MATVGRPRDAAVDVRVLAAALEELNESGPERFSLRGVARRAGVSRASLDRRWSSADELIVAALREAAPLTEIPDVGSFGVQLRAALDGLARSMAPPGLELQMRIAADGLVKPEALHRFQRQLLNPGRAQIAAVLARGQERGELPDRTDPALLADAIIGAILMRTMSHPTLKPPGRAALLKLACSLLALD